MTTTRDDLGTSLRQKARRAILANAVMRWESAVLLAMTLVGTSLLGLAHLAGSVSWLWPVVAFGGGLAAWGAVFISSLTDAEDNARAVARIFRERFNPQRLRSARLQEQVRKALEYRDMIEGTMRNAKDGILRERLERAVEPVDSWIEAIYQLALRLDSYELNTTLQQDLRSVPAAIENFKKRLAQESSPAVQATLRNTIADKERQWQQLSHLQDTMEKAGYQLESTLAMLGTVYAQLQTVDWQSVERGRAEQLRADITDQVHQLQDLSEAMDEVYQPRATAAASR